MTAVELTSRPWRYTLAATAIPEGRIKRVAGESEVDLDQFMRADEPRRPTPSSTRRDGSAT